MVLATDYILAVVAWQVLRLAAGDRWWWLALANTFSLYLFTPLAVLVPLALLSRRRAAIAAVSVALAAFLLLYGGLFLPRPAAGDAAGARRLRVMSYNALYENRDAEAVERTIRAVSPDVLCMQELTPYLADEIIARLGEVYPYRVLLPRPGTNGMGVFSRLPVGHEEIIPDPVWQPGSQAVVVSWEGQEVLVLNVHAVPSWLPFSDWYDDVTDYEADFQTREEESRRWLARAQAHDGLVVVAGDFNATDQNGSVRLLARTLQDTQRRAGWGLGHTWPARGGWAGPLPFPPRLWRLDYVFASAGWQVVHSQAGPWDGQSDHWPVWADLETTRRQH